MKLLELLIHRPVVSIVLNLLLVCLGVFAFLKLPVRQYPNIVEPVVTISTDYIGADPELMEQMITTPIENQLVGVEGMRYFSSTSTSGSSVVTITFELDADIDAGETEVRSRVNAARDNFPPDAKPPVIRRAAASQPIMYIQLDSDERSIPELTEYFELAIKPLYEKIPGIQDLDSYGITYGMRLWLDPEKLAARGLTPIDVIQAVQQQNLNLPGGKLVNETKQYEIRSRAELNTADAYDAMIVAYRDGYPIRFRDVGRAELAGEHEPPQWGFWDGSKQNFAFGVTIFPHANALEVAETCRELIPVVERNLPGDMRFSVNYDRTQFIKDSINDVGWTIAIAIGLVVLVVSLFLLSVRATLIPIITIPLSLFGAMGLIYVMGFSINVMTMLALVLAIGLVVDDAIVVVENTYRHIEGGHKPIQAALISIREIAPPIVATTTVLAVVYIPIGFMVGQTGELFRQFAFTLAGTVLISGYIALTLSPMMCSRLIKRRHHQSRDGQSPVASAEHREPWLQRVYTPLLAFVLHRLRPLVILFAIGTAVGAYLIYRTMPRELIPSEDQNLIFVVVKAPDGTNYDYMKGYVLEAGRLLEEHVPEAEHVLNLVGFPETGLGLSGVLLKPKNQRKRSAEQIVQDITPLMDKITGVKAIPLVPPPPVLASTSNQHVNFVMTTIEDYDVLEAAMNKLLKNNPETDRYISHTETDLDLNVMNFDVEIDRDAAASAGLTAQDVAMNVAASLAPYRTTKIRRHGRNYDVYIQMPVDARSDPSVMNRLYVRNARTGGLVPMTSVARMTPRVGPISRNHYEGQHSVTINANVAADSSLGAALDYLKSFTEQFPGVEPQFTGYSDTFVRSQGQFVFVFGAALIVVYLVLAAMFNSFIDPFIVLLTVPLAMLGGLALLKFAGGSMNLYSNIGLITLVGLITKQGILIVDFANLSRRGGMEVRDAIIEAAKLRLRPILMTTGAMVMGAVPLAIARGAGSEARHPLGWVIIGGLLFGTCLTLMVIPTVYSYLARFESATRGDPTAVDPLVTDDNAQLTPRHD